MFEQKKEEFTKGIKTKQRELQQMDDKYKRSLEEMEKQKRDLQNKSHQLMNENSEKQKQFVRQQQEMQKTCCATCDSLSRAICNFPC